MIDDASPLRSLPIQEPPEQEAPFKDTFQVTISNGEEWFTLTDGYSMWISPDQFGQSSITWRKEEAQSRYYHGTFLMHATKDNVVESIAVYMRGQTQNEVTEMIMMLEELFTQHRFQLRVQFGDHRETWYCQTADYQIDRGHIMMHNHMAKMSFKIPRLPETTKEIVL